MCLCVCYPDTNTPKLISQSSNREATTKLPSSPETDEDSNYEEIWAEDSATVVGPMEISF